MRFALPLTLLFVTFVAAAPVPVDKAAEAKQLETHWNQLWSADPVARTKAVFALLGHPRAAEFLAERLPPVDATKEQLTGLLKDLNSDDEAVWGEAANRLWYCDPRIALSPVEQIELVTTDNGRRLLASVWLGGPIQLRPGTIRTSITPQQNGNGRWFMLNEERRDGGSGTGIGCPPVAEINTPTWRRAAIAALILHRIDTKPARAALNRLASGHKDALPTRTAAELLKANAPASLTDKEYDKTWADLLGSDPLATTRGLFALLDSPAAVKKLKADSPAIKATKEDVAKWLKALDSEAEKEWKPAFEKLQLFRPLLALDWQGQCDAVTTDRGRSVVFHLAGPAVQTPTAADIYPGAAVTPRGDAGLTLSYNHNGAGLFTTWHEPGDLTKLDPPHWQRARLAIIALEGMKTDEAKAVLKQLADGHPDILPTKEAQAALERLKK